jgi:hypothetical protein
MPRLIMTKSGMSAFSMPTDPVPTMSGLARSSILVTGAFTRFLFTPIPVMPDCQAIECALFGS